MRTGKTILVRWLVAVMLPALHWGCSGGSEEEGASTIEVSGIIRSATGALTDTKDWVIAFTERDTGTTRVGDIDATGFYTLSAMNISRPHTATLLNSRYRFQAVLSKDDTETENQVLQFFTLSGAEMPTLTADGPRLAFGDESAVTFTTEDVSADSDDDDLPDGVEALNTSTSTSFALADSGVDTDEDGSDNNRDVDLDGDGIINLFDADDDDDGVLDIFDADANENGTPDTSEVVGDAYFPEVIEYFVVQVVQQVDDDNTSVATDLSFTTKMRGGAIPEQVSIKGATGTSRLLEGAQAVVINAQTGASSTSTWSNYELLDDGENGDGVAEDGVYARTVRLATGTAPALGQVVFLQITYGTGDSVTTVEFPYIFPQDFTPGIITGSYNASTRTVTLSQNPFCRGITCSGSTTGTSLISDFTWSVQVYDSDGNSVYSSIRTAADTASTPSNTFTFPEGILDSGTDYTLTVVAQGAARLPGYPAWVIKTSPVTVTGSGSSNASPAGTTNAPTGI